MLRALMAAALVLSSARAEEKRVPFSIPESTVSPDRRYGVTIPVLDLDQKDQVANNELVEMATGKVLAPVGKVTVFDRMNHESLLPSRWSADGRLLLWEVDGKWFPYALILLKLENGKVTQYDLLALAQKAILAETKKAAPAKYEAARKRNEGNGSAYLEGFSVDVEAVGTIAFPLHLRIALTANPKGIEDFPDLDSSMDAVLTAEGKLEIREFKLERGVSRHF